MNTPAPLPAHSVREIVPRILDWLLSWGLPLAVGLAYFAAYYPGFSNHDSQSIWLNAFRYLADPGNTPLQSWYSPLLAAARIAALKSGLGVAGYHAVFCVVTYGTWAALVASLLGKPWQRGLTHLLLLLPFIGANLAFQVPDVWVAAGLAWMVIALRQGEKPGAGFKPWLIPFLYFAATAMVIGARQNAVLALPVFILAPLIMGKQIPAPVRRTCAVAPLVALLAVQSSIAALPVHDDYKIETYMAFETIGIWKSVVSALPEQEPGDESPPEIFNLLSQPPAYYLSRWNPSNVDQLIWDTNEFKDKRIFIADNAGLIRKDYLHAVMRHPLHFLWMKLSFAKNGLGLTPPDGLPVSSPPPHQWIDQLGIPLYHRPLAPSLTRQLLTFNDRTRATWQPLTFPLGWCILCLAVFAWRRVQNRVTRFDYAWLMLLAAYYATILFFAPINLPRYVIPVWVILGAGMARLLLNPGANQPKPINHDP